MGYLTTFSVYNDGADQLKKNPLQFTEGVYNAMSPQHTKTHSFAVGNFVNLVTAQPTRHADDHMLYVHMGNTVCSLSEFDQDTKERLYGHRSFLEAQVNLLQSELRSLKKLLATTK